MSRTTKLEIQNVKLAEENNKLKQELKTANIMIEAQAKKIHELENKEI